MTGQYNIEYLSHDRIDKFKWDKCIDQSPNGVVYAYSFYLDSLAKNWDALVLNDYQAVMPLTWNRKYGIAYLYQPFLCAQLGLFSENIDQDLLSSFLHKIPNRFRYWDIYLNQKNLFLLNGFNLYARSNFILDLEKPYEKLFNQYRENTKRNIKKSQQLGCYSSKDFDPQQVIELATIHMTGNLRFRKNDLIKFSEVYSFLKKRAQATTYGIFSKEGQLLASSIFFFSHGRAYYILVGNHHDGKSMGASHALIDHFIKDHSGKKLLLDFEGSDLPNLAFFYSSFGAVEEKYAAIRQNRLPWFLRWLKPPVPLKGELR